jgi:metal-responsive CopG/Arc/MetJ family transcriptional regulator
MQRIPNSTKTAVILMDNQIAKLDDIASRFAISRSEALRRIVETGLESYAVYERLGVVKLAEVSNRIRKAIEKDIQPSIFEPVAFD